MQGPLSRSSSRSSESSTLLVLRRPVNGAVGRDRDRVTPSCFSCLSLILYFGLREAAKIMKTTELILKR